MTDARIAIYAALLAVMALFFFVLIQATPQFFYAHWRALVFGPLLAHPTARFPYTNLEALTGLVIAVGLSVFLAALQAIQTLSNRKLGSGLNSATREAKIGLPGLTQLQKELRKR